ncbi:hypothetical protein SAMN02799630_03938 [Paenibacillus sp. UNCCL117]|uniref:hypothetical protein n=1 Tax=unclassified Paenibacillus TaxID=185978 RepID=UPI0008885336|nr:MULTISPECIES: hypothetical protein [unclassified Paenibacillus]SDD75370.1 hypothetical protein SAMN04488602_1134 [Paenibacillus sp. cl123]SFW52145.1 hypothetical protein SAMN02799630_03938 [Paenibacillus sp. UNCCL117]
MFARQAREGAGMDRRETRRARPDSAEVGQSLPLAAGLTLAGFPWIERSGSRMPVACKSKFNGEREGSNETMTKRKTAEAEGLAVREPEAAAAQEAPGRAEARYSKEQLLESRQYSQLEKDVLTALLEDEGLYTQEDAKALIEQFMKRAVL